METPLLHRQKQAGSAARLSCKAVTLLMVSSAVAVLLFTSKQGPAELVQWVVPKAVQGTSVPTNHKVRYMYIKSGSLQNNDRHHQQVLDLTGSKPSKVSAVNASLTCCCDFGAAKAN
jgi:hypothetical protein